MVHLPIEKKRKNEVIFKSKNLFKKIIFQLYETEKVSELEEPIVVRLRI